ncbi:hypothetical protein CRE_20967 [Caenorhabditis remanei]|uniref:SPK domain-containing protein n=1 Tax=Caenorhabditis remanei TaxID=31234 RepID=E3NFQ4_CAERE|nr:hypothetical protein CRE_20967 [Caenorhabditis remanei]
MSDSDHLFDGFVGYVAEVSINSESPITKYSLSRSFKDLCKLNINDRFFCNKFDQKVVDRILKSKYDIELKARIFFVTSTPVTWPDFLEELGKIATYELDSHYRLIRYVSKVDGVTKFKGEHRKWNGRGRAVQMDSDMPTEPNRDDGEVFGVEEEVEDPEIIEPPRVPVTQPQMPPPQYMTPWMRGPAYQFVVPGSQMYYVSQPGRVNPESSTPEDDEGRSKRQLPVNNEPGPSTSNIREPPEMEPSPKKMRKSADPIFEERKVEDLIILEPPIVNQPLISRNPGSSFMDTSSLINHYSKFLREMYFFHGEVSGSFNREIKELYTAVENQNHGMNITPSKIKSHLEVCLDEICADKMTESDDKVNLNTMLNDLNQMARHLGDDLSMKIVPLVSLYLEETKESETVSKKGAKKAIENMINRLKMRAKSS